MGNDTKYLKYALNTKGELVHIDSVPNGNDCGCICPACKKPLQAKNKGTHRTHHFAHQSGVDCPTAYESSLHLLAKKKIQEAFYESQAITISFEYKSYCSMNDTCMYVKDGDCVKKSTKSFNLKDYYDRCEQEISYNNINRRSDLKFSSSIHPNKEPLYLEIYVTHASDSTKLHSGNKIIEAKIEKEEDIDKIIEMTIVPLNIALIFAFPDICYILQENLSANRNIVNVMNYTKADLTHFMSFVFIVLRLLSFVI